MDDRGKGKGLVTLYGVFYPCLLTPSILADLHLFKSLKFTHETLGKEKESYKDKKLFL